MLQILSIGIWMHPHTHTITITNKNIEPNFGVLAESLDDKHVQTMPLHLC